MSRTLGSLTPSPVALLAIVLGLVVHVVGFFLFRIEVAPIGYTESVSQSVSIIAVDVDSENSASWELALLADSLPLFLPSAVDFSWGLLQPGYYVDERDTRVLSPFREFWTTDFDTLLSGVWRAKAPELSDMFQPEIVGLFRSLGEGNVQSVSLKPRYGMFQFRDEASQVTVREVELQELPGNYWGRGVLWRPCEMMVLAGASGCVGEPLLRESSGLSVIDQFALRWVRDFVNRLELAPGYYRVVFGP